MTDSYEVLNPWAEADPVPVKGLAPRVEDLAGKTIGLYAIDYKGASQPILKAIEARLKERYPTSAFRLFLNPQNLVVAEMERQGKIEITPEKKAEFDAWVQEVDVAITAVGD